MRYKQDSNKLTGQFKSTWCIIYLEKCLQWSQNLVVINHFWALKNSHCKYTKPSFRAEGLLISEKAGATTQLPNLARNCSSIIYFRSSKYANNGHANLFLGTPSKGCKHVFVKCATIHAIVVSKKEPTLSQQVNSCTILFPFSFTPYKRKQLVSETKQSFNSQTVCDHICMKLNRKFAIKTKILCKIRA